MKGAYWRTVSAVMLACLGVWQGGCKPREAAPAAEQKAAEQKSTVQTAVEGFTGKTAVDQGQSAQKQLQAIDLQRRQEIEALNH